MKKYINEIELAKQAAISAGQILLKRSNVHIDSVEGKDIKLSSDKQAEAAIMDVLKKSSYSILSEEMGLYTGANGEYRWIIDPLDGTANYYRGLDELCCVSIALWKGDEPILGVINRFATSELYVGIVGEGAWKNDIHISTSRIRNVGKAVLSTGFPVKRDYSTDSLNKFVKSVQCFKKIRMLGTAAIMGTFVAEGKIDSYVEEEIMLWDIAASSAIVKAAGGCNDIIFLEDNKCICKLFANDALKEDYYANCI